MTTIYSDKENQTIGYNGKTTAPKTPFARSKTGNAMKTPFALKAKENTSMVYTTRGENGSKFVTPSRKMKFVTPNEKRVPLGGKDTNIRGGTNTVQVKPQKSVQRLSSGRRKIKQVIKPDLRSPQHADDSSFSISDELPDIEYMPPKAKELPFVPEDFEPIDYAAFFGKNGLKASATQYHNNSTNSQTSYDRKRMEQMDELIDIGLEGLQFDEEDSEIEGKRSVILDEDLLDWDI
ncbi:hypothetical protein V1514DRAFT_284371 [Lipomyces japonicus]|uniref:uncharacterized protein n=1 Tax=Lipomyces japonicus TaxID=56871 RepID=UPI0034CE5485